MRGLIGGYVPGKQYLEEKELCELLFKIKSKPEIKKWSDEKLVSLYHQFNKTQISE